MYMPTQSLSVTADFVLLVMPCRPRQLETSIADFFIHLPPQLLVFVVPADLHLPSTDFSAVADAQQQLSSSLFPGSGSSSVMY